MGASTWVPYSSFLTRLCGFPMLGLRAASRLYRSCFGFKRSLAFNKGLVKQSTRAFWAVDSETELGRARLEQIPTSEMTRPWVLYRLLLLSSGNFTGAGTITTLRPWGW